MNEPSNNASRDAWSGLEPAIRPLLTLWGYESETIDWVLEDLKKRPIPIAFPHYIRRDDICPACLPKFAEDANEVTTAFSKLMWLWLKEILRLECDLWVARFDPQRGTH
jgi:hypothetical protein